jgi:integrase
MSGPTAKPYKHNGTWCIRYTDEHGKRKKKSFESHADANLELAKELARVEEVGRGLRAATPQPRTFDEICDIWISSRAIHKRSERHDQSIIRRHLRPVFTGQCLMDVGVASVDAFVAKQVLAGLDKQTIRNHLTLLIAMLHYAVDLGWLLKVPRIKKPKVALFSTDYRYLRTHDEIQRFLGAAKEESALAYALYATAVFTGMRAGELAGLMWDCVDFSKRLITVQRSFDGPTKAGDVRYVPILDALLPVLRAWRLQSPGNIVFPNERGGMQLRSARIFQEIFVRVQAAAGLPVRKSKAGGERGYVKFHDLRHTFASVWMMNGGDLFRLQRILGHKSTTMTQRYAHLSPDVYTADHGRFSDDLLPAVATVTALPTASVRGKARVPAIHVEPLQETHAIHASTLRPEGRDSPGALEDRTDEEEAVDAASLGK